MERCGTLNTEQHVVRLDADMPVHYDNRATSNKEIVLWAMDIAGAPDAAGIAGWPPEQPQREAPKPIPARGAARKPLRARPRLPGGRRAQSRPPQSAVP